VSKYDFACRLARIFSLPEHYVHRGSIKDNPSVTKRPHDMSLSSDNMKSLACEEPGELNWQIQLLREQEAQGRHAELLGAVHGMNEARPSVEPPRYISYGQHNLDQADIKAVTGVLQSDVITQGEKVAEFGQRLADYTGARFGWPVSSGTAALHLSVAALGLGPGDEVITTPMTFCATSNAVLYQGATVRFVDIDENTLNINPELIEAAITPKTKAIIPVDFRGHPAALPQIKEIADHHGLKIIEDGAHSIGSSYEHDGSTFNCGDGVHADLCTFSFHPVKHITTGEGGAVMTNDPELHRRIFQLCKHGIDRREDMFSEADRRGSWVYEMDSLGFNYRMTDFQAALGSSQLTKLDAFKRRRREIVDYYNRELSRYEELILPFEESKVDSNFHLYVLRAADRSRLDRYDLFTGLQRLKYRPMVHYIPVHLLGYYQKRFGYKRGDYPVAERCYDQAISIPLHSSLSDSQVEKCVEDIGRLIKFSEN
jgi:UDP-4-amino-4,6-dideoxy-N-acetyl-beta-L-altrosamine transaminase